MSELTLSERIAAVGADPETPLTTQLLADMWARQVARLEKSLAAAQE